ncbi:tannase/feruloyl esterase family alpha/beta hydrolase [Undibacterium sp.]|uniref:tannase/feruloyl esterase family alpha/beta hydrolase n=1 Tax=Undibacterium sp. TaxID=1914977 RepID=UPI003752F026
MQNFKKNRQLARVFTALSAITLVACNTTPSGNDTGMAKLSEAKPAALNACVQLTSSFKFDNTRIESAESVASGKIGTGAQTTAYNAPEHCLVKGKMHERKGTSDQDFAIGFEMRLPKDWNGRFYHQVNGGIDGSVQLALGALGGGPLTGALAQGFAVISSDAGHTGRQNPRFGEDPQARADYGYQAVGKLTPMAKALIAAAYGKAPDRSYIGGCSNGGRHALVAASRYQNEYDGYLVGAPGYRLPNAALQQLWALPAWKALATPDATVNHPFAPNVKLPDLGTAFTAQERQTVANAILGKCDALDGAKDGIVQDTAACQKAFDLARDVPTCSGARDGSCLTAAQKTQIAAVHTGGSTTSGVPLYSSFPYDAGIAGANWAQWKFMNSQTLDPAAGYIFMTPPRSISDPFAVNINEGFAAIYATSAAFPESANTQITPLGKFDPTNLEALKARGAKILLYHGVSDAIFSHDDTAAWWNRVNETQGSKASNFARYFPIPGMNHCSAGPATDQFDALTPLVNWVERGQAPERIIATSRGQSSSAGNAAPANLEIPKDWASNRTRPLCAYPQVARYNGNGSSEDAASFSCK